MPAPPDHPALEPVLTALAARLSEPPSGRVWVACSGGLDSSVLLVATCMLHRRWQRPAPRVIHVDHGLHAQSSDWAHHVAQLAAAQGAECDIRQVQVGDHAGTGLEAAARDARYACLQQILAPGDLLLLAQHGDDQAETVLLRLLRGAGPAGLAAMPERRALGAGSLLRPLLGVSRQQLEQAGQALGIGWLDDPANNELAFDRNRLRHSVLPELRERWPAVDRLLARTAALCRQEHDALTELLDRHYDLASPQLDLEQLADGSALALSQLRRWLEHNGLRAPSRRHLQALLEQARARPDAQLKVVLSGHQVRRFRNVLYLLPDPLPPVPTRPLQWRLPEPLTLPDGVLTAHRMTSGVRLSGWLTVLEVRFRAGGEHFQPLGRSHGAPLKKLWQEWGVPPWQRARTPLLYAGEELVAVAGHAVSAAWAAHSNMPGWRIDWSAD